MGSIIHTEELVDGELTLKNHDGATWLELRKGSFAIGSRVTLKQLDRLRNAILLKEREIKSGDSENA